MRLILKKEFRHKSTTVFFMPQRNAPKRIPNKWHAWGGLMPLRKRLTLKQLEKRDTRIAERKADASQRGGEKKKPSPYLKTGKEETPLAQPVWLPRRIHSAGTRKSRTKRERIKSFRASRKAPQKFPTKTRSK